MPLKKKKSAKLQTLVKSSLGPLEREVLDVICRDGHSTVREVLRHMGHDVAYTTVMTTMDRLYQKGVLQRRKVKRAFVYSSALTKRDLEKQTAQDLLEAYLACRFPSRAERASALLEAITASDPLLINEIEAQIEKHCTEVASLLEDVSRHQTSLE